MRVWLFYKPFFTFSGNFICFVFFICRCHWKTEIGIYLKQRCCSPAYHFISPRGPQSEHSSISCGWSRCGIWKSNVCLSGNGLWGNRDSLTPCSLPLYPFLLLPLPPHDGFFDSPQCFPDYFFIVLSCSYFANKSFLFSKCLIGSLWNVSQLNFNCIIAPYSDSNNLPIKMVFWGEELFEKGGETVCGTFFSGR